MSMQLKVEGEQEIKDALEMVAQEEVHWAMFGYVAKNTLKFVRTGNGINNLVEQFPEREIVYVYISQRCPMQGTVVLKNLLLSMVGPFASAIVKARSSAHRGEFGEYVRTCVPLSSHFQANEVEEICEEEFLAKLRVDPQARAAWKRQAGEVWNQKDTGTSKLGKTNFGDSQAVTQHVGKHKKILETVEKKKLEGIDNPEPKPEPEIDLSGLTVNDLPPDDASALPASQGDDGPVPISVGDDGGAVPPEEVAVPAEDVVPPEDVGIPPEDVGVPPEDIGVPPEDVGVPPEDIGDFPVDGGLQFCGECGIPRIEDDMFCGECGSRYE